MKATREAYDAIVHEKCTGITLEGRDWNWCVQARKGSDTDPYICVYMWRQCFNSLVTGFCDSLMNTLQTRLASSGDVDLTPTQRLRYTTRVNTRCLQDEDVYH